MKSYLLFFFLTFLSLVASATPPSQPCKIALTEKLHRYSVNQSIQDKIRQRPMLQIDPALAPTTVFYPFGGIDLLTPLQIAGNVRKIVSVGLHPFGNLLTTLQNLETVPRSELEFLNMGRYDTVQKLGWSKTFYNFARSEGNPKADFYRVDAEIAEKLLSADQHGFISGMFEDFLFSQAKSMLSSNRLRDLSQFSKGLGVVSLLEIQHLLGATIQNVEYLNYEEGEWQTYSLENPPTQVPDHGKITFQYQGRSIEYYFIRANLMEPNFSESGVEELYTDHASSLKEASENKVITKDIEKILGNEPRISILKWIHQAYGKLDGQFQGLYQLLRQSEYLYTEGTSAGPESFPEHERILPQGSVESFYRKKE